MAMLAVTAVVGLVLAGAPLVTASIPSANGTIHGCYDKTGALRVIDVNAAETCSSSEQQLNWNQTGPQGNPGTGNATNAFGRSPSHLLPQSSSTNFANPSGPWGNIAATTITIPFTGIGRSHKVLLTGQFSVDVIMNADTQCAHSPSQDGLEDNYCSSTLRGQIWNNGNGKVLVAAGVADGPYSSTTGQFGTAEISFSRVISLPPATYTFVMQGTNLTGPLPGVDTYSLSAVDLGSS